jgi:hypothetical protein
VAAAKDVATGKRAAGLRGAVHIELSLYAAQASDAPQSQPKNRELLNASAWIGRKTTFFTSQLGHPGLRRAQSSRAPGLWHPTRPPSSRWLAPLIVGLITGKIKHLQIVFGRLRPGV